MRPLLIIFRIRPAQTDVLTRTRLNHFQLLSVMKCFSMLDEPKKQHKELGGPALENPAFAAAHQATKVVGAQKTPAEVKASRKKSCLEIKPRPLAYRSQMTKAKRESKGWAQMPSGVPYGNRPFNLLSPASSGETGPYGQRAKSKIRGRAGCVLAWPGGVVQRGGVPRVLWGQARALSSGPSGNTWGHFFQNTGACGLQWQQVPWRGVV